YSNDAYFSIKKLLEQTPSNPQGHCCIGHTQQVKRPIRDRKERKPQPHNPRRQRRVLGVAERRSPCPTHQLRRIMIYVLTCLCEHAIDCPENHVAAKHSDDAVFPPRGTG